MTAGKRLLVYLLPISLALIAANLSGCGSSSSQQQRLSKNEYREKLIKIAYGKAALQATRLFGEIVVVESPACAKSTREFAASLHEIVRSIAALRPPRDVEALQSRFLKEARISVAAVDRAARDAETGQLACGNEMNKRIYGLPSTNEAEAVIEKLREKRYLPNGE